MATNRSGNASHNGPGTDSQPYKVLPQYHSQPGDLRVICVGAGAAGLLLAYKMKMLVDKFELVCYEKNPDVAGTWYENRYPGCACDVPAHIYTYSFEPNPNWSSFYAYAPEIKKYFSDFAENYDLKQYVKLNSRVKKAVWDDVKGIYNVDIECDGKVVKDWCNIFVNATGFLNDWKWPKIPGLQNFKGKLMHSAKWDPSADYTGKRVGVIGTGSSAIQIVPQVQKKAKHVTAFMRSVTWIAPPVSGNILERNKQESDLSEKDIPANAQYFYSEEDKKRFRDDPDYFLQYRRELESGLNAGFAIFEKDSEASAMAHEYMKAEMLRRIGPGHEELKEKLIPSWPPGCRRLTPGDGYLEALVQPNVTTVHKEIGKIVPEGVLDETGTLYELDVLACATGFNIAFAPPFELRGDMGASIHDEWDPEPQCYLGLTAPKFPNYFVVNGPRGQWASGSVLPTHEAQVEYICKFAKRIQEENIKSVEVKKEAVAHLYEHMEEWHHQSVWDANCKSWYKNNIIGGKLWIWGGSGLHYIKTIIEPKYEHYDFKYRNPNMFAYLGNGRTEPEVKMQMDRLAPYIRNKDRPWKL